MTHAWLKVCLLISLCGSVLAQETQDQIAGEPTDHYFQTFVAQADGSGMRLLATLPEMTFQGSAEWSRDGKLIAFDGWKDIEGESGLPRAKIALVNADGTNARVVADGCMPSFSPKGNRLAYSKYTAGVWLLTISDAKQQPVQLDPLGWGTAWSPDGGRIVYARFAGVNLISYDLLEGTRTPLFSEKNPPYRQIQWNFAWSPDSKRIALKAIQADGKPVLAIVDVRGAEFGHTVRYDATDFLPHIAWSSDGKQILIATNCPERANPRQLYTLDPETNDPPRLVPQQPANRWVQDASFSPDGSLLVFSAGRANRK